MNTLFYKIYLPKKYFLYAGIIFITLCFSTQSYVGAEGQAKYCKDVFDTVEPIKMRDPLAVVLGAMDKGDVFTFAYADAVKCAGHSCPAVAGAYKSTQIALNSLYGSEIPVRGSIKVTLKGGVDYKVNGPISQVVSFITGASAENGFRGLGPAGKYGRYNLMSFEKDNLPDSTAICSLIFERIDNGKRVEVTYYAGRVPTNERIDKLMPMVISGKASEEESGEFGNLWQERVKTILINPPDGTFLINEFK